MNRNVKIVLLVTLFALVCLAILWGRWFPDNRSTETASVDYMPAGLEGEAQPGSTTLPPGAGPPMTIYIGSDRPQAEPEGQGSADWSWGDTKRDSAAEVTPPKPAPSGELPGWRQHVVQNDEKLWGIAALYYGDGSKFQAIIDANEGVTAKNLKAGRVLRIPPLPGGGGSARMNDPSLDYQTPPPPSSDGQGSVSSDTREYIVKPKDSLSKIAKTQLGKESRYAEIAKLNGIGEPYTVREGQRLKLPAR